MEHSNFDSGPIPQFQSNLQSFCEFVKTKEFLKKWLFGIFIFKELSLFKTTIEVKIQFNLHLNKLSHFNRSKTNKTSEHCFKKVFNSITNTSDLLHLLEDPEEVEAGQLAELLQSPCPGLQESNKQLRIMTNIRQSNGNPETKCVIKDLYVSSLKISYSLIPS